MRARSDREGADGKWPPLGIGRSFFCMLPRRAKDRTILLAVEYMCPSAIGRHPWRDKWACLCAKSAFLSMSPRCVGAIDDAKKGPALQRGPADDSG